uniref:DUF38 domain-containing protein n=2 Tax=Strongyloides stercoralis TaxID=6248 RepID=A0AAF5CWJ5_STRER
MEEDNRNSSLFLEKVIDIGLIFHKLKNDYLSSADIFNLCLTSPTISNIISDYSTKMYIDIECDYDSYSFNNPTINGPYPYFIRTEDVGREKNTFKFVFKNPKKKMYIELGVYENEVDITNKIQDYSECFIDSTYSAIQFTSCKSQNFEQFMKTLCSSKSSSITTLEAFPMFYVIEHYLKLNETYTVELKNFTSLSKIKYEMEGIGGVTIFDERIANALVCGLKNRPGASVTLNWRLPHREVNLTQQEEKIKKTFELIFSKCISYGISISLEINVNILKIVGEAYNIHPVNITSLKIYNYTEKNLSIVEYLSSVEKFFEDVTSFTINFSCPCYGKTKYIGLEAFKKMKSVNKMTINFCKIHGTSEENVSIVNNLPINVRYLFLYNFSRYSQAVFESLSIGSPNLKALIIDSNKMNIKYSGTSSYFTLFTKLNALRHDCLQHMVTYPKSLKILVIRCNLENQNCFCGSFIQDNLFFQHHTVFVIGDYYKVHFYHNDFKHLMDYLSFDSELIPTHL